MNPNGPKADFYVKSLAGVWFLSLTLCVFLSVTNRGTRILGADETPTAEEAPLTEGDRDHWSFRPIIRPELPITSASSPNPIDRFVAARLQSAGLTIQPAADPRVLLRRLSFDLVGLPPSPDSLREFETDASKEAFEQRVDELLDSPQYGERWAQHWLDLARFAETDGFEHDIERPTAWKYRDWVIDAINRDLAFDEFVRDQIAGDELHHGNVDALTATQFCFSGPDMPDINDQLERKHTLLNDMTATIGTAILGLQIGCAQCHDHKYDPVSQKDFHRLKAIFEGSVQLKKNQPAGGFMETAPFDQPSHLLVRGDFRRPGPAVPAGFIRIAGLASEAFVAVPVNGSSGRRTALARWLTSQTNPLTSRVVVNRVWQQHFGTGLSSSPADFGIMGQEPTHPELLDWLADWFVNEGWSLKKLHRLIVTSETWRQRSRLPADASTDEVRAWRHVLEADPDLRLRSRFARRRLDGEAVRDAMLAAAEILNPKRGGPGIRPPLPPEIAETLLAKQWTVTPDSSEHLRRSIYIFARRNLRYPLFETFDRPDANLSCPQRHESTTAIQALTLLNSPATTEISQAMATNLIALHSSAPGQVTGAFERILGRLPDDDELSESLSFLEAAQADGSSLPLAQFCVVLFNLSEFVWID